MAESASQVAASVAMVRPVSFGFNAETAHSNRFQQPGGGAAVAAQAAAEFAAFAAALSGEGVTVCVVPDSEKPPKPDAVFPNNWVSFHADGTVVLYPMQAQSRRAERELAVIDTVVRDTGFIVRRTVDLTHYEQQGRYLEGTGSLVLDHVGRVAYACLSPRTDEVVARAWAAELGYELELFAAADEAGVPIYHTNVILAVGTRSAVAALDCIAPADRARIAERLRAGGRDVVAIDMAETRAFAGNMLELGSWDEHLGDFRILVMSRTARRALVPEKYARLAAAVDSVLAVPIETIERHGGGSVRCMLAEVFTA